MRHTAVKDDRGFDTVFNRRGTGLKLGDHAARDDTALLQRIDLISRHAVDQFTVGVQDARDVCQEALVKAGAL